MKLVYIVNHISGPGGLERVLSLKANYLEKHFGYEIHFITLNEKNIDPFYQFSKGHTFHSISVSGNTIKYLRSYIRGIKLKINEIKPDVISVCDDGLKGLLAPWLLGKPCPIIYERHISKSVEVSSDDYSFITRIKKSLKFRLMNLGTGGFDRFVLLTEGNKKEWKGNNIQIIPNPLSFYPNEQSNLSNKTVLAVGKHSFQKGYDRLLKSWKTVSEKHPNWKLEIYGSIYEDVGLDKLANNLGISSSVSFHNPTKNIAEKYKEASIYVMSSRFEGFGMVLTEAMAYGVPCISFDCPHGPADIISNNEDGILVENNNVESFSEALSYLIENKSKRIEMGSNARKNVQRYAIEKIAKQWDDLFKSLINTK